jgi:hypothetical protein
MKATGNSPVAFCKGGYPRALFQSLNAKLKTTNKKKKTRQIRFDIFPGK